ncbi:unnamed protein product, partial [Staurois parvus]
MKFFFKRLLHTFHIHFVPTALSCALPAFLLFFLPGNLEKSMASKKRPFMSKSVLDRLENSDSKSEPLAEL